MRESEDLPSEGTPPEVPGIRWPPPGLERMQGDLLRIAARAGLGGGILVLPLLFVLAKDQNFASLGPFADAWWAPVVLAVVGLTFAVDALLRTVTLLRRGSRALEQGYDFGTILNVLVDGRRDMGFLLTGSRHYSVLDSTEREAIGAIRVFSVSMYAIAGTWLPNALALGLLGAARGFVTPTGLWMGTLLPSLTLYLFGAVASLAEDSRVRRARRAWHQHPWADELASAEARSWREGFAADAGRTARARSHAPLARVLRRSAVVVGVLAGLVSLPILTLIPSSIIGPLLTELAVPGFDTVRGRAARAEALRTYVVPVDPNISPAEAGRLLHDIAHVGAGREVLAGEREPSERIPEPWLPDTDAQNPMGMAAFEWPDSLLSVAARGVSEAQRTYLAGLAAHPARYEFSRLARAGALDIASARFQDPLPSGLSLATMPMPWIAGVRLAAYSHLGAAAFELVSGRPERAEEMVSEVVSVGLLMGDASPILIDNVVGYHLVDAGSLALADLYEATGQESKWVELADLTGAAERAATRVSYTPPEGVEAWVRSLPSMVSDTSLTRGLRWEYFVAVATLTPCLNLRRMVFGPEDEYQTFLERAHATLVAWPSEEGLFELARGGWFGTAEIGESWLGRVLGLAMRRGESTCGDIIAQLQTGEALF